MHAFACSACFKCRPPWPRPEGQIWIRRVHEEMIIVAHQAIGIAGPAKTVDDLDEKGAPLHPIAVVTTMSWRAVPRLVTWYTAPVNSIRCARAIERDA